MKIWNYGGEKKSISEALQLSLPEHAVISVSGAGGKTSLIFSWADELASLDKRVAVTTTTHMSEDQCNALAGNFDIIVQPDPDRSGKVKGPSIEEIRSLRNEYDALLIEADGARRMPLKWPAEWEPVIPEFTDISVVVVGLSSLGRPCSDVIFRAELIPAEIIAEKSIVDEQLVYAMLSSPGGGRKSDIGDFRIFINQADNESLREKAEYLQKMLAVSGIQSAWGSLKD